MTEERQLTSSYVPMEDDNGLSSSTEPLMTPSSADNARPAEGNSSNDTQNNESDKKNGLERKVGSTVAEVVNGEKKEKILALGHSLRDVDAAWYVFDNLSCDQAEDLLRRHGDHGSYLVSHFHDPESYGLSLKIKEEEDIVYKHYAICIKEGKFQAENFPDTHDTIEQVIDAIQEKFKPTRLIPIFHRYNCETCDYSIDMSEDKPPSYSQAQKYPEAARRALPIIVPIRPTLRRMMGGGGGLSDSLEEITPPPQTPVEHGCCWKLFHTDPQGVWYKPHKAGPITAILLIIGWIFFIIFFGWIVALALVLVFILIIFAYILNFICTGRCKIEEDDV